MTTRYPKLAQVLREKSLTFGKFILASGRASTYYIDGKLTCFDPLGITLVADAILEEIRDLPVEAVGGMDMGATPIVAAVACRSYQAGRPLPSFIVRKDVKSHGTMKLIEGPLPPGPCKVVIIDDVVTTGDSILKAVDAVAARGCEILLAISVLDRNAGAAQALAARGIAYHPLVTLNDLGVDDGQGSKGSQAGIG